VAQVEKLRAGEHPILVVDSGDLFFKTKAVEGDNSKALGKARLIAKAYRHMRVSAINVGDLDLLHGLDFLREEASKGLPLISTNLLDPRDREPIFAPHAIQEVSGLRVAFMGLLSPKHLSGVPQAVRDKVIVKEPTEAAVETLRKLENEADLLVLLSDLGLSEDRKLAKAAPGIHFILGGHDGRFVRWPDQEGETYIMQSYRKGMYIGTLKLTVDKNTSPFLDEGKPGQIRQKIKELDRRLQALQKAQDRSPNQSVTRNIQRVTQERAELQKELQRLGNPHSAANRFRWSLWSLNASLPEDKDVRGWILESGIKSN
jgi:2',3'-cyclic-nucleotide 2'-phosphodiesterase (5'-nucleotidase family)